MTPTDFNDRLDDIASMGGSRLKAHVRALFLDVMGENDAEAESPEDVAWCEGRNDLREYVRRIVGEPNTD